MDKNLITFECKPMKFIFDKSFIFYFFNQLVNVLNKIAAKKVEFDFMDNTLFYIIKIKNQGNQSQYKRINNSTTKSFFAILLKVFFKSQTQL
jgi:hypothetical protein